MSPAAPMAQLYHELFATGASCVMLIGNENPGFPVCRMMLKLTDQGLLSLVAAVDALRSASKALMVHLGLKMEDMVHPSGTGRGSSMEYGGSEDLARTLPFSVTSIVFPQVVVFPPGAPSMGPFVQLSGRIPLPVAVTLTLEFGGRQLWDLFLPKCGFQQSKEFTYGFPSSTSSQYHVWFMVNLNVAVSNTASVVMWYRSLP